MRVILSGGGTGGHIYPALAIWREIEKNIPTASCLYIGTAKGLESTIVSKENIPFEAIEITGFKRKLSWENVKTIMRFYKGVQSSKRMIRTFQPDIVIGTGGYVCGPVVYAASRLNIPTLIHEQNVVPGLTNKFLSRYTSGIAVSFEQSSRFFSHSNVRLTGNPRATEVLRGNAALGRKMLGVPEGKKLILIVGGSRGAKAINDTFLQLLEDLSQFTDCFFVYVTGDIHFARVEEALRKYEVSADQVVVKPFLYNMPDVLAGTDVVVSRAGASFLAEITALGIPSILIPSPYVTNNHQEKNARWLEENGASKVILEKELDKRGLQTIISTIVHDQEQLAQMKIAAKALGLPKASEEIFQMITELSNKR